MADQASQAMSAADPGHDAADVRSAFELIRRQRPFAVPVVGSGLAAAAGAPTGADLAHAFRNAPGVKLPPKAGFFVAADQAEKVLGADGVQRLVADLIGGRSLEPTRTLNALVRLPSRTIATTNYDDAVSVSAIAVGLKPRVFFGRRLNEGLSTPPAGVLHVLHLHGHHSDPSSIVLSEASYRDAAESAALTIALQQLASQRTLVFLGQSLATREAHWHRDLLLTSEAFDTTGPHLLLLPHDEATRPDLTSPTGDNPVLVVASYDNYDRKFMAVDLAAQALGLGPPRAGPRLPQHDGASPTYLPLPIIPADDVESHDQRQARAAFGSALGDPVPLGDLVTGPAALVGSPGAGKTQTLADLGARFPAQRPVIIPLGNVTVPEYEVDPALLFCKWAANGFAFSVDREVPEPRELSEGVTLFLLDGLDEVDAQHRAAVMQIIEQVADRHPQHVYTVATRPFPGYEDLLPASFAVYELFPDRDWFGSYVKHVGIRDDQLDQVLGPDSPLADLLRLPIFAQAVVEAARERKPLPRVRREAILLVARRGFVAEEPRLLYDSALVDRWLDRLALAAEIHGTSDIPSEALSSDASEAFGISADQALLDRLIQRTLLHARGRDVAFTANVIQEARAARALRSLGDEGLRLLKHHALIELDDGTRGVAPAWRHTIELLLEDADEPWRRAVAAFDGRLTACATATSPEPDVRDASLRYLLKWYETNRVWWLREGEEGQFRGDLEAIILSMDSPELRAIGITWASDGLRSESASLRGNALRLLTELRERELVDAAVPAALADEDPVVRRFAAHSVSTLEISGHHHALRDSLIASHDELEQRALATAFIQTAPETDVADFLVRRWPKGMDSWAALNALDTRLGTDQQLRLLSRHDVYVQPWMDHLLKRPPADWFVEEVGLLAGIVARSPRKAVRSYHHLIPVLRQHPVDALRQLWTADELHARRVLHSLETTQLKEVTDSTLPADLKGEADRLLNLRTADKAGVDEPEPQPEQATTRPEPSVAAALAEGWETVVQLPTAVLEEHLEATTDDPALRQLAYERWSANGDEFVAALTREDDTRIRGTYEAFTMLTLAAHFCLPLSADIWARLLALGYHGAKHEKWLVEQFDREWFPAVAELIPHLALPAAEQAAHVLPAGSIPLALAHELAAKLNQHDSHRFADFLHRLADAGRQDVLKSLHDQEPSSASTMALAQAGDCQAERELLEAELARTALPASIREMPGNHWLSRVKCSSSTLPLIGLIRRCEVEDVDSLYSSLVHAAFRRAAGIRGLAVYDELTTDTNLPESRAFLWHRRAELLAELLAAEAERRTGVTRLSLLFRAIGRES